jgi:hypothetical protein
VLASFFDDLLEKELKRRSPQSSNKRGQNRLFEDNVRLQDRIHDRIMVHVGGKSRKKVDMDVTALGRRDALKWWLQQMGIPNSRFAKQRPDYLIISPPKTGSTWLADNLRRHPDIFVPSMKEIKYFSSFFKSLDLSWYLDQIAPGEGRIKGEASPSYALLPVERIQLIHWLMPDVKIIFLMRDPIGRAWSHAKHNHRYGEANFIGSSKAFAAVDDADWMKNFTHDWPLASGDYLGQLRRWLTVFPREQLYVGFYESIASNPESLLREVLDFLGAGKEVDLRNFPLRERILEGPPGQLSPRLCQSLRQVLHDRTVDLVEFLRNNFGLIPPPEWRNTLTPSEPHSSTPAVFAREFDDAYLSGVLEQEEAFPSAWCPVIGAYQGFNLTSHRGQIYAIDVNLGNVPPAEIPGEAIGRYLADGQCFIGSSLAQVRAHVDQFVFDNTRNQLSELPTLRANLNDARHRLAKMERAFYQTLIDVSNVQADLHWLRPWFVFVERVLRPAWRRLRRIFGATQSSAALSQSRMPVTSSSQG